MVWLREGWAPPSDIAQESPHGMSAKKNTIQDQSSPGSPRTAPPAVHQSRVGEKWITGVPKKTIRARNITIGTCNVRTLKNVGKLEELQHEMKRYDWNILGLCESRLLKAGEKKKKKKNTQEGHRLFWSGQGNIHEQGVGLLVHKNTVNCVIDCCPISNRLITIRLRAKPFNITIIQAYAPTSAYSNEDVEVFYEELQKVLNKTPKKDIL